MSDSHDQLGKRAWELLQQWERNFWHQDPAPTEYAVPYYRRWINGCCPKAARGLAAGGNKCLESGSLRNENTENNFFSSIQK